MVNKLGVQDAPRKRSSGEQEAGAWAGSIIETDGQGEYVTVSQERWDKSERYIGGIVEDLSRTSELNHKELEKKRGSLLGDVVKSDYAVTSEIVKCTHIAIVPRLMTGSWRKGMMK